MKFYHKIGELNFKRLQEHFNFEKAQMINTFLFKLYVFKKKKIANGTDCQLLEKSKKYSKLINSKQV